MVRLVHRATQPAAPGARAAAHRGGFGDGRSNGARCNRPADALANARQKSHAKPFTTSSNGRFTAVTGERGKAARRQARQRQRRTCASAANDEGAAFARRVLRDFHAATPHATLQRLILQIYSFGGEDHLPWLLSVRSGGAKGNTLTRAPGGIKVKYLSDLTNQFKQVLLIN